MKVSKTENKIRWPLVVNLFLRFPELLALLVVTYYSVEILADFNRDTISISNTAVVICGSLTALAFGFARVLNEKDEARDRIVYAGERFFHATILLLLASLTKYGIQQAFLLVQPASLMIFSESVKLFFNVIAFVLFLWASLAAHTGIKVLNKILIHRTTRKEDWDDVI